MADQEKCPRCGGRKTFVFGAATHEMDHARQCQGCGHTWRPVLSNEDSLHQQLAALTADYKQAVKERRDYCDRWNKEMARAEMAEAIIIQACHDTGAREHMDVIQCGHQILAYQAKLEAERIHLSSELERALMACAVRDAWQPMSSAPKNRLIEGLVEIGDKVCVVKMHWLQDTREDVIPNSGWYVNYTTWFGQVAPKLWRDEAVSNSGFPVLDELERLRRLVREAYEEGMRDAPTDLTKGGTWEKSEAFAALIGESKLT